MALDSQKHMKWTIWDYSIPFWTSLEHCQACHVLRFLVQKGPFLTPAPSAHHGRIAIIETASIQVDICLRIMRLR